MIKSLIAIVVLVQFSSPSSCNKKWEYKKEALAGLWTGTFTVEDGSTGTFYFSIKPEGQLLIENYHKGVQRIANGTWDLTKNKFTCTGTYFHGHPSNIGTITSHEALFDGTGKLDSGVWKNITPNNDTGEFTLHKIR